MASLCAFQFNSISSQHRVSINGVGVGIELLRMELGLSKFNRRRRKYHRPPLVLTTACSSSVSAQPSGSGNKSEEEIQHHQTAFLFRKQQQQQQQHLGEFHQLVVAALSPVVLLIKRQSGATLILGFCMATVCLIIAVRMYVAKRLSSKRPGTVADLVRRGQLRSDRRGISKPLKYEDPFNNPLVKISNSKSTVEMCGKVYRLAPVTLTEEQRAIHQKRRSRAYQWKRPKVFLKEGDSIPADVDPDTVRWIPANHPFATTASDIDEDIAQNNVYQKHGVPFRIQAEHEALQRKLEALQSEQKLNKLVIDPVNAKDYERAFKTQLRSPPHDRNNQESEEADQSSETVDGNAASAKDADT